MALSNNRSASPYPGTRYPSLLIAQAIQCAYALYGHHAAPTNPAFYTAKIIPRKNPCQSPTKSRPQIRTQQLLPFRGLRRPCGTPCAGQHNQQYQWAHLQVHVYLGTGPRNAQPERGS
eukprot:1983052-Rhodomonas_salina.2